MSQDRVPMPTAAVLAVSAIRRRVRRRGQSGYVLGIVLAAMVVGFTLITALLGLSFATHASAISQQRLARELRASDGALEVGVDLLRDPGAICTEDFAEVSMQLSGSAEAAEDNVTVDCLPALDQTPNVTGGVKILGDTYEGALALQSPLDALPAGTTLRHQGDEPLTFIGNVRVNNGAAVDAAGPGAEVAGSYIQGLPDDSTDCGTLSPSSPDSSRHLVDSDDGGEPACGDPNVGSQVVPHVDVTPPDPVSSIPDCVPGGQVTLLPGYYGPAAVDTLNERLSCGAAVFSFAPTVPEGDVFWFDAGQQGNLEFDSAADYAFGTLAGSGCDRSAPGATVVLGAGTGINHTAGDVSICGSESEAAALVQADLATTQPTLVGLNGFSGNPAAPLAGPAPDDLDAWRFAPANGPMTLAGVVSFAGGETVGSLALRFKSWETPPSSPVERWIKVTIQKGALSCSPTNHRGRTDDHMGTQVDLTDCLPQFGSPGSLDGASLTVEMKPSLSSGALFLADVQLVVNPVEIGPTGQSGSGYVDTANILAADGAFAYADPGPPWCITYLVPHVCARTGDETAAGFALEFAGTPLPSGVRPTDHVSTLVLALDLHELLMGGTHATAFNHTAYRKVLPPRNGSTQLSISDGSSTCDYDYSTYTRSRQTVVLDVSDCFPALSFEELAGLSVSVTVKPETRGWVGPIQVDAGPELPWIDYARLIATTDSVSAQPNLSITVDESGGSSFRVDGDTIAPDLNVDVNWLGTADPQPLFDGELAVWSLGSQQDTGNPDSSVGVICCGTDYPSVALIAEFEDAPEVRGLARLRLEDEVVVTDWQLCDRSGCTVDLVGVTP